MRPILLLLTALLSLSAVCKSNKPNLSPNNSIPYFLENKGQIRNSNGDKVDFVLFQASQPGLDVYITEKGIDYVFYKTTYSGFSKARIQEREKALNRNLPLDDLTKHDSLRIDYEKVHVELINASIKKENIITEDPCSEEYRYILGAKAEQINGVKKFKKITFKNVYPNIDWVWKTNLQGLLEYEFIVHPGGNYKLIQFSYTNASIKINETKNQIQLFTPCGNLNEGELQTFSNGEKIKSEYKQQNQIISFDIGKYNPNADLVIDPPMQLFWGTYVGGANNVPNTFEPSSFINSIKTDNSGNIFAVGSTSCSDYPLLNSGTYFQGVFGGLNASAMATISKYTPAGVLLWSTFVGGKGSVDDARDIVIDKNNNLYVVGITQSKTYNYTAPVTLTNDFPLQTKPGAYMSPTQWNINTQWNSCGSAGYTKIGFIMEFQNSGTLLWSTLLGGAESNNCNPSAFTFCSHAAIDKTGNLFVSGRTFCKDFPTVNAAGAYNDGTLNNIGEYFITKFDLNSSISWSTYLGEDYGEPYGLEIDSQDNLYFATTVFSPPFSTSPILNLAGAYNQATYTSSAAAYLAKFKNNGQLLWSTFYSGNSATFLTSLATNNLGDVYISGTITNSILPSLTNSGGYFKNTIGGVRDNFIVRFNSLGAIKWATYLGGSQQETPQVTSLAIDTICNSVYFTGLSFSGDLPITNGNGCNDMITSPRYGTSKGPNYLMKFDKQDKLLWCTPLSIAESIIPSQSQIYEYVRSSHVDNKGNYLLAGSVYGFGGNMLKDPGAGAYFNSVSANAPNGFILKFNKGSLLPITTTSSSPTSCSGLGNATVSSVTCADLPLSYKWNDALNQTTATANNLAAGTYTVTVTDNDCAVISTAVTITPFTNTFNTTAVSSAASCGASTGSINVSVASGTGPYTYTWSNGSTTATGSNPSNTFSINNVIANSYTVTVTESGGCSSTTTAIINNTPAPTINSITPTTILCNGGSASATISASGTGTLSYLWSNGNTGITASGLSAGTQNVTVTDGNGCLAIQSFTITQPTALSLSTPTVSNATCNQTNGSITITNPTGGTGLYTYSWSNGASTQNISSLAANSYTLTVTDNNNCTITTSATVIGNNGASIASITKADALCNGGTGSATVNITGGASGNYTYSWSNGANTITTATSNQALLTSNTYTVTVIDGACSTTSVVSITAPPAITLGTITPTAASCGQNNGTAVTAAATGGTGTLTYSWSNGNSGLTANNLSSGTYTLTVRDGNNCTATLSTIINNSPAPTINSITPTNAICNGGSGIAVVAATGTGTLTYSWSNGNTGSTASNLTAGTYTLTVSDGNGCNAIQTTSITQPPAITLGSITPTSASCGQSNGSAITTTATGGTGTLTYSWSNGNSGQTATNLSAQTYTLTVSDANNCSTTTTVNIGNTGGASISTLTKTDALCNGGTGNATVNITGGASGNYTYSWSNGANTITTATSNQELLTSNTYTVTVIDGSCTVTTVITITQPTPIIASAVQNTPASCGLNNGEAIASATGGNNSNYNYVWSNGTTTSNATGLSAASYVVTITDANNCTQTTSVNVSNSPAPTINSITPVNPLCNGATGTASVTATGTGTLTYVWSNGTTTTTATNLTAGNYNITVTDGNGCKAIQSFSITEPIAITLSNPIITNASCNQSNGAITLITPTGGTTPYTYSWSNGASTQNISLIAANGYTVTVKDNNGCSITTAATVTNTNGTSILAATATAPLCNGNTGSATVTITPSTAPYTYSWSNGASTITTVTSNQEQLTSNSYTVTVTDANNCSTTTTVQINQPATLNIATPIKTDASCNQNNGSISIIASGGTTPYTYNWSNGVSNTTTSTTSQISNLTSQIYTLTLTDANNCSTTTSITINNTNSTVNAAVTTNISSNTISEGESIVLSAGGGTSYTWTPNNSLSCATCPVTIANPTATTTYTLIVKDNLGCADTTDITINVKKPCTGEEDVFIANVFSPNNDGKNDVLQIQGNGLTNIYFAIYDRWGNLMFETRDQAQGWDGNVNGNTANAGTYVYYLKATCKKTAQEIILKGNVSVVK